MIIMALLLTWLSCVYPSIAASATAKLFFQKKIDQKGVLDYKVKKGDNLYSILRDRYGPLSPEQLSSMTERIEKLNPDLEDPDRIYPGQNLNLPKKIPNSQDKLQKESTDKKVKEPGHPTNRIKSVTYTVQSGDHLYKILRDKGDLTNKQIDATYLYLFKELNPGIKDIHNLQVGQRIVLPLPVAKDKSKQEQLDLVDRSETKARKTQTERPKDQSLSKQEERKRLAMSLLRLLGFTFISGKEIIYPYGQNNWCHINIQKTPLARSPWGGSTIFIPRDTALASEIGKLRQTSLQTCPVPPSWSLEQLLKRLEELFANKLIYWQSDHKLILNQSEQIFELKADFQVIVKHSSKKSFYLFNMTPCAESCPSPLAYGYLADQNIFLYELGQSSSNCCFMSRDYPESGSLYQPKIPTSRIKQIVSGQARGKDLTGDSHLPGNNASFLNRLKELQLASRKQVKLSWGLRERISLKLPLYKLTRATEDYYLLPPEQANPYLVALLRLNGYKCYIVSNDDITNY